MLARKMILVAVLLICVAFVVPALATTYYVKPNGNDNSDGLSWATAFATIQKGIDTSSDGNIVEVNQGTFNENVNFGSKSITVHGAAPAATVINGNGLTNVVEFGANSDSILSGFTVTGGTHGIYSTGGTPTVSNCIIKNNSNDGIYAGSSTVTIKNSIVNGNNAGVSVDANASISNCTIVKNSSYGITKTGENGTVTISNCILWGNNDDLSGCATTYSCVQNGDAGTGNISSYPYFANYAGNDFHLTWNSPCINKGDPDGNYTGQTDIDGENRVADEKYVIARVDMGAEEFNSISDNLVQNPGFELGGGGLDGTGPSNVPLHWKEQSLSAISIDSTVYHSDGNSCKNTYDGTTWVGLYSDFIAVDINKTYTFSAWIKGQTGNERLCLAWREREDNNGSPNASSSSGSYFYDSSPVTTYWRRWYKVFTPDVNTNTRFINLVLLGRPYSTGSGTIWFDDVSVTENPPEFLPAYGCVNEPNLACTIKFGGSEQNTDWVLWLNEVMSDPCADQDDNNITYRALKIGWNMYIEIPAFNIDPNDANGFPLTPMLLEIMYKDTTPTTDIAVISQIGYINPDPCYGITDPNAQGRYIAHLGDRNDNKWKYLQYAFQKSDFQLLRAIDGKFKIEITSPSGSPNDLPISYISLRAITQTDYAAFTNKQRDMRGYYEIEMPTNNPANPSYADPNLTVFVRDIMHPVYPNTEPDVNEPCGISIFSTWGEVEPACFSIYSVNGINDLTITVSDLTNGSSVIASSNITAYKVIYGEKKLACYPDIFGYALLPDRIQEFDNLSIEPNTSESIWLKINIPYENDGCAPGLYTGQVTIKRSDGKPDINVPIGINVYNITLDEPNHINPAWTDAWYQLSSDLNTVYSAVSETGIDPFSYVSYDTNYITGINMISFASDPYDSNNIIFDDTALKNSLDRSRAEGFLKNYAMLYVGNDAHLINFYKLATKRDYSRCDPNLWNNLSDPCFVYWFGKLIDKYKTIGNDYNVTFLFFPYDEPGYYSDIRIICDRLSTIIHAHNGLTAITYNAICDENCSPGNYDVPTADHNIPPLTGLADYKIWGLGGDASVGYVRHKDPCYFGQFGYATTYFSQNCNPVYNRFSHGLFAFGTDATIVFGYKLGCGTNDPYDDFDATYDQRFPDNTPDYIYSYPTWSGRILYSIGGLEATREGIKDSRYIATLKKLIAENPNSAAAQAAQGYLDNLKSRIDPNYQVYTNQSTEFGHYQAILKEISPTSDPNDYEVFTEIRKQIAEYIKSLIVAAYYPVPDNGEIDVNINADLSWKAGTGATSHDVYFGTSYSDVNDATNASDEYRGNQTSTTWDTNNFAPNGLEYRTTYYWRIDENNDSGTIRGGVWSFTTAPPPPDKAMSPSPDNNATDVNITTDLSWTAGTGATSHLVYFGTTGPGTYQGEQTGATFDTGTMANGTTYYWRIDEKNVGGTTTGDVWSFTTIAAPGQAASPSPSNVAIGVGVTTDLSWTAGAGATSHLVYFGTTSPGTYQGEQTGTTFDTGTMANGTTYYWRIDEKNAGGTTQGTVWKFITSPDHYWALDETSGVTAYDSNNSNGTFNGDDPCWVQIDGKGAVDLNGVSDYFSVSSLDNAYTSSNNFTVAGWFRTSQSTGIQTVVGQWSQWLQYNLSFSSGWQVLVEDNKVKAKFVTSSPATPSSITGTTNVTDGNWHHFALVYPKYGQSLNAVLYVDGNSEGTPGVEYFTISNTKFRIGDGSYVSSGSPTLKGGPFCGTIDDVMIFNRALTASEVNQLYLAGR